MNKKFLFRVWTKSTKKMQLSPEEIEHLGSWFDAHLPGALANNQDKVIMQYTGRNDKNNTKIFEGDIVLLSFKHFIPTNNRYLVRWNSDNYSYEMIDVNGSGDEHGISTRNFSLNNDELEVIGNIHENPELTL